jgi:hypothetical protein
MDEKVLESLFCPCHKAMTKIKIEPAGKPRRSQARLTFY